MIDRETVIKGIECCSRPNNTNLCGECPYNKSETRFGCMHRLITDVFAMLKEQEPKHVKVREQIFSIKRGYCPKCGIEMFNDTYPHWCGNCGQEVIWDD